ncbi:Piso0_003823 [Millerozyma farinosa CBS 7064]|uniref:Piso0_003823 protein n=1 Tax=Pichia sorbitophila (strain ATCC MYA-4447 / BCRC 22081 / CBS 7064 / NBRC 10061 / NRRL Y-12695) TaxID=559304 RepID=G8Y8E5_PICSO|nr:Piso0_003823 [Millerozyma farinosa CBS 7064]CCE84282.1 Piso0_003823 [Millerozyma farinosa CBS 7064]
MIRSLVRITRGPSVRANIKFVPTAQRICIPFSRGFHYSAPRNHGHIKQPKPGEELKITFITKEGEQHTYEVAEGDNILDIAQAHNLDMEGACGGSCACSTCHIIVDPEYYDAIPEPDDDENDMLDLAFGLTETSRLGCQVVMTKELDGIRVALPAMTRNLQQKDFK